MSVTLERPATFAQGLARNATQSMYPVLWQGLVAWWDPGMGVQGPQVRDNSGLGNHATMVNITQADWTAGNYNLALSLNGTTQYLAASKQRGLDFGTDKPISIACWVKQAQAGTGFNQNLISSIPSNGWVFFYTASGFDRLAFTITSGSANASYNSPSGSTPLDDKWHHYVVVCRRSAALPAASDTTFFLDGKALTTTVSGTIANSTNVTSTADVLIGARLLSGVPARFISGAIGAVGLWSRELKAREVMDLYRGSSPLTPLED